MARVKILSFLCRPDMKGRIVLLLSLLCVAQALPLSLDENTRASLTRGKRHEHHHHHHHEHSEIADKEVRTIISAIVDAILDGDRKKRSDIPEEEDDVASDMSSESGSGEASGDYERVSVPKNIKDVKGANDDPEYVGNIFQKSDEESTDATKILKLDSVSESGENVGSGSGSDSDLNVESETESGAESGSGSESESESGSGLGSGSESESSKKRSKVSETNDLEQSGDSESGSSGSGEDADTSGEFNSGSGDNEIVGIVGDENARLIDDDNSKRTNAVGDNEGRMKRDEDGLDEQDIIESKARQEKEKKDLISDDNAQLSKLQNKTILESKNIESRSVINNSENDSDNESGSGSGETSESGSGDFSLEKRNSVLEKRSQIVQEDNFGKLVNELDNDNTDTPDNDSENESDDESGNESGSQSGTESGDSTNSDSFTEPPDKRSLLRGEDNKYKTERYAAETYSEEESESGMDSESGSGSSDGSGSPWDSASGFGFEKRETTPLFQQYENVNNTMQKANESESIAEDDGSGNSEKDSSSESGDASSTMESTLNESDEGYSSGEDDENLQPDEENEPSSAQLEREDKNINNNASLVSMEDSNKSKYGSQSSIKNTKERPKAEVVSDNEGESESDIDEISGTESESGTSGSESESESGSGSDARRKNIIHQIVSDMAKAAVDSIEVDDSDSVVKKSNINIPDEVTPTKSNNLAIAKRTIENRTFEDSTNVNSDDSENTTKKGMVNSERDLALKTLVKSVLKDDPSVKASIEELKKRRSESEEKLYKDILGLVQQAPLEPEEDTKEKVITEVKDFEGFVEALSQTENLSSFKHDAIAKKLEKDLLEHLSVTEKDDSTLTNQENELLKDTELTHIKERIEDARESSEEYALKHTGSLEEIRRHAVASLKPIIEALPLKKEDVDDLAKLIGKSAWVKMITHTKRKAHISKKIRRNLEELFALK